MVATGQLLEDNSRVNAWSILGVNDETSERVVTSLNPTDAMTEYRAAVEHVLGKLEADIMTVAWGFARPFTVRDVLGGLNSLRTRRLAYTTVMTTVVRLADKGLLRRTRGGYQHQYEVAQTPRQFLYQASLHLAERILSDFGDVAIASFLAALETVDPERLNRLKAQAREDVPQNEAF